MRKQKANSNQNGLSNNLLKPRGLVNLGNTCYFNSIMQVLLNAPLFGPILEQRCDTSENKYILADPNSDKPIEFELPACDFSVKSIVDLHKTYMNQRSINTSNAQPITPSKVISCIRQKTGRFKHQVQEDSHELLRSLLDMIRSDEVNRQKAAIEASKTGAKAHCFTIIDMIFGGYFLSSVQCQKCKFKSEHFEPFFDLSLAITDPIKNIRGAISNFFSNAILDGDNKFMCQRCTKVNFKKTYEAGVKSTRIAVPPNILTLHLKRFEASGNPCLGGRRKVNGRINGGGRGKNKNKRKGAQNDDDDDDLFISGSYGDSNFRKINKQIEFSEYLNLSHHTDDICYNLTKVNGWPRISRKNPIWYSLFAVVCHSGQLKGGHYTAYVKYEDEVLENNDSFKSKEFSEFIQSNPYLPDLTEVEQIRAVIKQHDQTHCHTTDIYDDEDDDESDDSDQDNYEKPKQIPGNWYHISDSSVRNSTITEVLNSQAYLLFYRRIIESPG